MPRRSTYPPGKHRVSRKPREFCAACTASVSLPLRRKTWHGTTWCRKSSLLTSAMTIRIMPAIYWKKAKPNSTADCAEVALLNRFQRDLELDRPVVSQHGEIHVLTDFVFLKGEKQIIGRLDFFAVNGGDNIP